MNYTKTIPERIKDLRKERKVTLEDVAEATGLSRSALGNYEDTEGDREISHSSIIALAKYYGVSTDYLLGLTENQKPITSPVSDLHLDDETVSKLKSGAFNNRLWGEITKHPMFPLLLVDMEVYIDGIASMQINTLNSTVDTARNIVLTQCKPDENDYYIHTLKTAHIDEFRYFSAQIHNELDQILQDLRKSHVKDSTSASKESSLDMVKDAIKDAASFKGSSLEKQIVAMCSFIGFDYHALEPEDYRVLFKISQKSKRLKKWIPQRGKRKQK